MATHGKKARPTPATQRTITYAERDAIFAALIECIAVLENDKRAAFDVNGKKNALHRSQPRKGRS